MHGNIRDSHEDRVAMPLQDKRVLVTRAQAQAHDLEARLRALGALPLAFPTIHITPPRDGYAALDAALRELTTFDWVVFTSVNGVDHVWQRLAVLGLDDRTFSPGCDWPPSVLQPPPNWPRGVCKALWCRSGSWPRRCLT